MRINRTAERPSLFWYLLNSGEDYIAHADPGSRNLTRQEASTPLALIDSDPLCATARKIYDGNSVPQVIARLTPQAKLLMIAREPVARFQSAVHNQCDGMCNGIARGRRTTLPWECPQSCPVQSAGVDGVATKQLQKVRATCMEGVEPGEVKQRCMPPGMRLDEKPVMPRDAGAMRSFVGHSIYTFEVERWLNVMGRGGVRVLFYDDWKNDWVGFMQNAMEAVGVERLDGQRMVKLGIRRPKKQERGSRQGEMSDHVRASLQGFYCPFNRRLARVLNSFTPLSWCSNKTHG